MYLTLKTMVVVLVHGCLERGLGLGNLKVLDKSHSKLFEIHKQNLTKLTQGEGECEVTAHHYHHPSPRPLSLPFSKQATYPRIHPRHLLQIQR